MIDTNQDEALIKADLRNQTRLEDERSPWESVWKEVDERFPNGAGGFEQTTPGQIRGEQNYDTTAITALGRFAAAMTAITVPEEKPYIVPKFSDPELMKDREVKLYCERLGRRLYDIRGNHLTGFYFSAHEDFDQLGRYGTSAVWQEAIPGRGLIYRTLHLSEIYIDTDGAGLVDTVHRKFEKTARESERLFGLEALTPKMRECLSTPGKEHTKFQLLHIVCPNTSWDAEQLDWRRMPVASRYLAMDEKLYLRRSGFHTMPITVSRHVTSPMEKYGRSPAINKLPDIHGVNAMRHTTLRAGHKAVDPALIFFDDDGLTGLSTKPGGLNPGLVNEDGRPLVARMPGGDNGIPYALEMIEQERAGIRAEFLEEFYKILTDPNSRMTTTEVLEVMGKQGILVRPYASRYRTEKQGAMCDRDFDLALRAGQVEPLPAVVAEAGAWPVMDYDNPLSAMAKAEEAGKSMRFVEVLTQWAAMDQTVMDYADTDELIPGVADAIGVPARYVRSKEQVAAMRKQRAEAEAVAANVEALGTAAGAFKDIAQGNAIAEAA
jgi:hypothetical protein